MGKPKRGCFLKHWRDRVTDDDRDYEVGDLIDRWRPDSDENEEESEIVVESVDNTVYS